MAIGLISSPATWLSGTVAVPSWFQTVQDNLNQLLPVAMVYVTVSGTTYTIQKSVNITSVTRNNTGDVSIVIATSPATSLGAHLTLLTSANPSITGYVVSVAANQVNIRMSNASTTTATDASFFMTFYALT